MKNKRITNGPDFSRFRRALMREGEPDRVPLAELSICAEKMCLFLGKTPEEWNGMVDAVEFMVRAGYDYVPVRPRVNFNPSGKESGRKLEKWVAEGRGLITNFSEFEKYPWDECGKIDIGELEDALPHLPEGMKMVVVSGDIFATVWSLMGWEVFCSALVSGDELVDKVAEKVGDIIFKLISKSVTFPGVGALWLTDSLASTDGLLVAPEMLRRLSFPWYERIGSLCREKNIPFILHADGNISSLLDDFYAVGVKALHPVEPKAMDIYKLKKEQGHRFCFIGNVELDRLLVRSTPRQIKREVHHLIHKLAPGGGFCIGSSHSIPYFVPYRNYLALIRASLEYGSEKGVRVIK